MIFYFFFVWGGGGGGGGGGVVGCILDLPEGSLRDHMLPLVKFSEVS